MENQIEQKKVTLKVSTHIITLFFLLDNKKQKIYENKYLIG